jgi:hypothetical protein
MGPSSFREARRPSDRENLPARVRLHEPACVSSAQWLQWSVRPE